MEKIIKQIEKLLALSKSSNEHEAAAALARAEELLEKHRLDIAEIEMMSGEKERIVEDSDPLFESSSITPWESRLANGVAFLNGCTTITVSNSIKAIGRASDIVFVRYFVTYITLELFRLSADVFYKKRQNFKDSWFLGAVDTILGRLRKAQSVTRQSCQNVFAVETVNNRYNEAIEKLKEFYPDVQFRDQKAPEKLDSKAYFLGAATGKQIQLSHKEKLSCTQSTLA